MYRNPLVFFDKQIHLYKYNELRSYNEFNIKVFKSNKLIVATYNNDETLNNKGFSNLYFE